MNVLFTSPTSSVHEALPLKREVQAGLNWIRGCKPLQLNLDQLITLARHFKLKAESIGAANEGQTWNYRDVVMIMIKWSCHYWEIISSITSEVASSSKSPTTASILFSLPKDVDLSTVHDEAQMALANAALIKQDLSRALKLYSMVKTPHAAWNQSQIYLLLAEQGGMATPKDARTRLSNLRKAADNLTIAMSRLSPLGDPHLKEKLSEQLEEVQQLLGDARRSPLAHTLRYDSPGSSPPVPHHFSTPAKDTELTTSLVNREEATVLGHDGLSDSLRESLLVKDQQLAAMNKQLEYLQTEMEELKRNQRASLLATPPIQGDGGSPYLGGLKLPPPPVAALPTSPKAQQATPPSFKASPGSFVGQSSSLEPMILQHPTHTMQQGQAVPSPAYQVAPPFQTLPMTFNRSTSPHSSNLRATPTGFEPVQPPFYHASPFSSGMPAASFVQTSSPQVPIFQAPQHIAQGGQQQLDTAQYQTQQYFSVAPQESCGFVPVQFGPFQNRMAVSPQQVPVATQPLLLPLPQGPLPQGPLPYLSGMPMGGRGHFQPQLPAPSGGFTRPDLQPFVPQHFTPPQSLVGPPIGQQPFMFGSPSFEFNGVTSHPTAEETQLSGLSFAPPSTVSPQPKFTVSFQPFGTLSQPGFGLTPTTNVPQTMTDVSAGELPHLQLQSDFPFSDSEEHPMPIPPKGTISHPLLSSLLLGVPSTSSDMTTTASTALPVQFPPLADIKPFQPLFPSTADSSSLSALGKSLFTAPSSQPLSGLSSATPQESTDDAEDEHERSLEESTGGDFTPLVSLPELAEIKSGEEEEEVLFCHRAKLFRFDQQWKERGVGDIKVLKHRESGKVRLLMRREQVLKLCCNHYVTPEMALKPMTGPTSDKSWTWFTPCDFAEGISRPEKFAIRFKQASTAQEFQSVIEQCVAAISQSQEKDYSAASTPEEDSAIAAPSLLSKFAPPPGSWCCSTCFVQNAASRTVCVACQTPKPLVPNTNLATGFTSTPVVPSSQPATTPLSIFSRFALPGSWMCSGCYVQNQPGAHTCVACNVKKSDDQMPTASQSSGGMKIDTLKPFSPQRLQVQQEAGSGMQIGALPKFLSLPQPPLATSEPAKGGMKIPGLNLGQAQSLLQPSFQPPPQDKVDTSEPAKGGMKIRGLNLGQGQSLLQSSFQLPSQDKEGGMKIPGLSLGPSQPFLPQLPSQPFTFKLSTTTTDKQSSEAGEDDHNVSLEHEPDVYFKPVVSLPEAVSLTTGEEEEAVLFSHRAKLFRFDTATKQWKERGLGDMKILKNCATGKIRLLMRREQILKICCNHYITPGMSLSAQAGSDSTWNWYTPSDFADQVPKSEKLALKFKFQETAQQFKDVFDDCVQSISQKGPSSSQLASMTPGSLASRFAPRLGSWSCVTCLVQNKSVDSKCAACGSARQPDGASPDDLKSPVDIVFPTTAVKPAIEQVPEDLDDNVTVTLIETPSPEKVKQAEKLPPMFYNYENKPSCPGCRGCEECEARHPLLVDSGFTTEGATTIEQEVAVERGEQERDVSGSEAEGDVSGNEAEGDISGSEQGGDVSGSEQEKDVSGSEQEQDVSGSEKERDVSGSQPKGDVMGTVQEIDISGSEQEQDTEKQPDLEEGTPGTKDSQDVRMTSNIVSESPEKPEVDSLAKESSKPPDSKPFDLPFSFGSGMSFSDIAASAGSSGFGQSWSESQGFPTHGEIYNPEEEPDINFRPLVNLPEVAVTTGEEGEEMMFCHRAKLFRFDGTLKQWKERGVGDIKILRNSSSNKCRILMRRDQILKVCCNHYITTDMNLKPKAGSTKSWIWYTPSDFADEVPKPEKLAVRFKHEETAKDFQRVFDLCVAGYAQTPESNKDTQEESVTDQKSSSCMMSSKAFEEIFAPPSQGSWTCDSCYITNNKDHEKCAACCAANPAKTITSQLKSPLTLPLDLGPPVATTSQVSDQPLISPDMSSSPLKLPLDLGPQPPSPPPPRPATPEPEASPEYLGLFPKPDYVEALETEQVMGSFSGEIDWCNVTESDEELFSHKGRLLQEDVAAKDWKEIGNGVMKILKHQPTQKLRLLMSSDDPNLSVLCSHAITTLMRLRSTPQRENSWVWCSGEDHSSAKPSFSMQKFCIEFDTLEAATGFRQSFAPASISSLLTPEIGNVHEEEDPVPTSTTDNRAQQSPEISEELESDNSVMFLHEDLPDPELVERAKQFMLPKSFYLYEKKPPCPGCRGCREEIEYADDGSSSEPDWDVDGAAAAEQEATQPEGFVESSDTQEQQQDAHLEYFASSGMSSFADLVFSRSDPVSASSGAGFSQSKGSDFRFAGAGKQLFATARQDGQAEEEYPEDEADIHFKPIATLPETYTFKSWDDDAEELFCHRAKLFRFDAPTKQWKERGVGDMKILKHRQTGKVRLIMRRAQIFKICCNHYVTSDMILKPHGSEKSWVWFTPCDFTDEEPKQEQLAIKFKHVEKAQEFKIIFDECARQDARQITSQTEPAPLPSSKESSLATKFKSPEGTWDCDACYVPNKPDHVKCLACGTPRERATSTSSDVDSGGSMSQQQPSNQVPLTGVQFGNSGGIKLGAFSLQSTLPSASAQYQPITLSTPKLNMPTEMSSDEQNK